MINKERGALWLRPALILCSYLLSLMVVPPEVAPYGGEEC